MKSISKITEKETNQLGRYLNIFNMQTGYLININYKNYEIVRVEGKKMFPEEVNLSGDKTLCSIERSSPFRMYN